MLQNNVRSNYASCSEKYYCRCFQETDSRKVTEVCVANKNHLNGTIMLEITVFSVWQKLNFRVLFIRIKNKFLPHGKHMSPSPPNLACHGDFIRLQAFLINFIGYRVVCCGILTDKLHKLAIKCGI